VGPDLKLNEWVDKQLVGMKDWKTGQTIQKIDNSGQYYIKNGDKWELLTWDRIKPVLDAAKKTDPFFQSWARQQAVLNSYQAEHVPEDALMQSGLYKQIWDEKQRTGLPAKEVYRQMLQDSTLRNIDSAIEQFGKKHEVRNHEWERSVVKETEEFGRRAAAEEKKKSNFGFGLAYAANDPGLQVKDTYNFNEIMSNAGTTAQKVRGDWESWLNAKGTDGKPLRKIEGEKFLERTPGGKWTDVTSEGNTRKNAFISQLKEVENLKAVQKAALEEAGFNEAEIRSITNKSTQTLMDKYKRYENPVGGRQMMGDNTRMPAMMKDESTLLKTSDERFKRYEKILTNRLNGGQSPNELLEIRDADAKKTIKDLVSLSAGKGVGLEKGMIPISIGSGKDQGKQLDEDDYEDIASTLEPVGFINDVATGKTKLIMRTTKEVKGKKTAGEDLILETTALTGIDEHLQQNMTARDYTKFAMDRAVKTSLAQTQSGMTTLNLGSADKPVNISIQRTYDNKTPVFKVVIPTADGQTITEKVQSYDAVADLLTLLKTGQQ
jgi:hypothetical protein